MRHDGGLHVGLHISTCIAQGFCLFMGSNMADRAGRETNDEAPCRGDAPALHKKRGFPRGEPGGGGSPPSWLQDLLEDREGSDPAGEPISGARERRTASSARPLQLSDFMPRKSAGGGPKDPLRPRCAKERRADNSARSRAELTWWAATATVRIAAARVTAAGVPSARIGHTGGINAREMALHVPLFSIQVVSIGEGFAHAA
jgi:hypothetical protein